MTSSTTITPTIRKMSDCEFVRTVIHFTTDTTNHVTLSSGIARVTSEVTGDLCRIALGTNLRTSVARKFPGADVRPIEIVNCEV